MRKPESVPENEIHKILWDFEIQTDPSVSTRRSTQECTYQKWILVNFSNWLQRDDEREQKDTEIPWILIES